MNVAKKLAGMADSENIGKTIAQFLDLRGLSKDLVNALTERAIKQKDLVIDVMAKEFSVFLSKINIADEAQKVLDGMTLDVQASLNFKDKKGRSTKVNISGKDINKAVSKKIKKKK